MFEKGKSGNPNGRPKGARNIAKKSLLEKVQEIVDGNMDLISEDIRNLDSATRIKAIIGLMQYVLPKQQSVNVANQIELEYQQLEILLQNAPDEAAALIATKMIELKGKGGEA